MSISYNLRNAVYLGKLPGVGPFDYIGAFLVKQSPFKELIRQFSTKTIPGSTEYAAPYVAAIFGKSAGSYNSTSVYDAALKTACSFENYVVTPAHEGSHTDPDTQKEVPVTLPGDFDTYYTPTSREQFLQDICVAGVWDGYGIKEAVTSEDDTKQYVVADGISFFSTDSIKWVTAGTAYSINIPELDMTTLFTERLCNFALSVYGNVVCTVDKDTHSYSYITNELGYNIILVPVIRNIVTIPAGLLDSIAANITDDSDKQQEIAEILCSAYSTVSCISPVFRNIAASQLTAWGSTDTLTAFIGSTPIFEVTPYKFSSNVYFSTPEGDTPEGLLKFTGTNITVSSILEFSNIISMYSTQDKKGCVCLSVSTNFRSLFVEATLKGSDGADLNKINCYFYVSICSDKYLLSEFNHIPGISGIYTYDGINKSYYDALGPYQGYSDYHFRTKENVRTSTFTYTIYNFIYRKKSRVVSTDPFISVDDFITNGVFVMDGALRTVVRSADTINNTTFDSQVTVTFTHSTYNGPNIYVSDEVLGHVGEQSIPSGAIYPELSAESTFGNGFLYADLIIPSSKSDVRQLNIYSKDSYSLHYIIAKNNMLVLFEPSDLFVYPKNVTTSITAKYEIYTCTKDTRITKLNSKVYLDSAVSNNGEIDIRAAASGSNDTDTTALAYTTLVGTPFTELSISSVLVSLLTYTGYVDHAFYETELVTLINGIYTTVSSLIGRYYYVCVCFPGTTDVCILKVDSQTSTTDGKTGYKVTICNTTDVVPLFVNQEAIPALNNSSATCKFVDGNPAIDVDGYRFIIDTQFINGQSYYMFTLNSDTGDTSEFALALSTKLAYLCNCKIPVLSIDDINTSIINITDGIVTFMINNVAVTLNSNTGMLYYSDDVFELNCSTTEVSGIFEYMKYCTVSSVFYGVYKVTSADSNLYTVTSDGIILGDLDFSVEEIDE